MSEEGRDFDPPATLPTDAVVGGKYVVVRLLGSGGMGAVYGARNSWAGRRVAVKLLHPQFARKPEIVRRFLREAKAATAISPPNIVDVLDMGEAPGAARALHRAGVPGGGWTSRGGCSRCPR